MPVPEDSPMLPPPSEGRVFERAGAVLLGDVGTDGRMRLDALARVLQDVAGADLADSAIAGGYWVLRRTAVEFAGPLPRLGERVDAATWCSGLGAGWAERRTDLGVGGYVVARAAAIWVHVDRKTLQPARVPPAFSNVYGPSAGGRRVRARLSHDEAVPESAGRFEWPLRAVDFDVLGHVNNAVYWAPLVEALVLSGSPPVARVEIEFRAGLDPGDEPYVRIWDGTGTTHLTIAVGTEPRATLVAYHG